MNPMLQQFTAIALPIMVTFVGAIWIAQWSQNKRFDDLRSEMNRRFDEIHRRLDEIIKRIVTLEERTSPFRGRG
jgi:hypothetical protein